jgi:diguanylate cyclase (GGDEF)-like protein
MSVDGPSAFMRAVRIASVPPALRELVRRLGGLSLEVELGPGAERLEALVALVRLAELEPERVTLEGLCEAEATRLVVRARGRALELRAPELERSLGEALRALTLALASSRELYEVCAGAAAELSRAEAERRVIEAMLGAPSQARALALFVAGVTAGHGLGFHRAALFEHEPSTGRFVGRAAVGPLTRDEAHRIWESIEAERLSFERQLEALERHEASAEPGPLARLVCELRLEPWVLARGADGGVRASAEAREALAALDPPASFVLAPVSAQGRLLGLVYADDKFADAPPSSERGRALVAFVAHAALAWSAMKLREEVEALARYDALTGLLTRRELDLRFEEARALSRETRRPLSLLLVDLDRFREINNTRGHEAGDAVLRALGAVLREALSPSHAAGRFGGDEVMAVLPGEGADEARALAVTIGRRAAALGISLSVGAATYPSERDEPDELLSLADRRLYQAKAKGRGRLVTAAGEERFDVAGDGVSDARQRSEA